MKTVQLAFCAVMTALLIAVQYALGFVSGIELVTVLFLSFCYVFGVKCGLLTGAAFSLLRCLLFGFMPNVVLLYLVYYSLFAMLFGFLGKRRIASWVCPVLLAVLAAACAYFALSGLPISILYRAKVSVMLWILFGIALAILAFYTVLAAVKKGEQGRELASVTALAAVCTVVFTLLDDIITPLFLGYSAEAAAAYFYAGFIAMLPQTICAAVSVFVLFLPLKKALGMAADKAVR